jgi:putative acetyltransferase
VQTTSIYGKVIIKPIVASDNAALAQMIRTVLTEFAANKPGTVFTDPTTDNLFASFQTPRSHYFVAKHEGKVVGACGIYPTKGMPEGCTELVKLYVSKPFRGTGLGKHLMLLSIEAAKQEGYQEVYLETLPELHHAIGLYEQLGFEYLNQPYGDSGHFACDIWMRKPLI